MRVTPYLFDGAEFLFKGYTKVILHHDGTCIEDFVFEITSQEKNLMHSVQDYNVFIKTLSKKSFNFKIRNSILNVTLHQD